MIVELIAGTMACVYLFNILNKWPKSTPTCPQQTMLNTHYRLSRQIDFRKKRFKTRFLSASDSVSCLLHWLANWPCTWLISWLIDLLVRFTWFPSTSGAKTTSFAVSTWRICRPTRRAPLRSFTSSRGQTTRFRPRPKLCSTSEGNYRFVGHVSLTAKAAVTTTIRLRCNCHSTAV